MRTCLLVCATVILAQAAAPALLGGDAGKAPAPDRLAQLIRQLGDKQFAKREAASKELEALGEAALPALRQAAASAKDAETRRRAEALVAGIGQRLDRTDVKSVPPPKGATVLFDGRNLDAWVGRDGHTAPAWRLLDGGVMEARGGDIRTQQTFAGSYNLHVEFRVPHRPGAADPARGNSGVYLHGRYEVQILDSHGQQPNAHSCGAIYGRTAPRVNACKAPGVWQTYDIEFHPPRFKDGRKDEHPRLTVFHNGVRIHDNVHVLVDNTGQGLPGDPAQPGPVLLQDHGCPVQFRNVWLVSLPRR